MTSIPPATLMIFAGVTTPLVLAAMICHLFRLLTGVFSQSGQPFGM